MVANGKKVSCTAAIPTFRIIADICKGGATVCEKTLFDPETLTGRWGISDQFFFFASDVRFIFKFILHLCK